VLAGIAASDAACCARLGVRARGQAHAEAVELLGTVEPGGTDMAKRSAARGLAWPRRCISSLVLAPVAAARMPARWRRSW
jgi:hypothetical protein